MNHGRGHFLAIISQSSPVDLPKLNRYNKNTVHLLPLPIQVQTNPNTHLTPF